MIKVADTAKNQVSKLMKMDGFNPSEDFIRVGVKSGGCSGLSYELNFDKNKLDNDKVFEHNGIKIVVTGVYTRKSSIALGNKSGRLSWPLRENPANQNNAIPNA